MAVDRSAAERAIAAFLTALGHDPQKSADLRDTPARVVEAFERDLLSGYSVDVPALLAAESTPLAKDAPRGLVLVRDVSVATVCPHHLLPGLGRATIAYTPGDRIVGIGTLARVAEAFARRLTLQETIGEEVVRALVEHGGARGASCTLEFRHTCLAARGSRQNDATVVTVARAGAPLDLPQGSRGGP
jgi:GTP cyclohydrolase IA